METDRVSVLTIRAAVRGAIDFSQARLADPDWWRRCHILLAALAKEDDLRIIENSYHFHLASIGNSSLDGESLKRLRDFARETFYDIMGNLRPWEGSTAEARKEKEIEDLRQRYINRFGDPSDPAFQEEMRKQLEIWENSQKDNVDIEAEEMDRIDRLRKYRDERLAARQYEKATRQQGR